MWKFTLTLNMVVWQSQLNIHSLAFFSPKLQAVIGSSENVLKAMRATVLSLQKISITTEQTWSGDTGYGIKVNTVFKFNQFPWRWDCILDFKSKKSECTVSSFIYNGYICCLWVNKRISSLTSLHHSGVASFERCGTWLALKNKSWQGH